MKTALSALFVIASFVAVTAAPSAAHAGRGIVVYQSGSDIFESGPLPAPFDKSPQLAGAKAGYRCSVLGLFWAYMHTWNCQAVGVRGDQYFTDASLVAAIDGKYKGDMNIGVWAKHGRIVFGLLLLGAVVMFFIRSNEDDEEETVEGSIPDDYAVEPRR